MPRRSRRRDSRAFDVDKWPIKQRGHFSQLSDKICKWLIILFRRDKIIAKSYLVVLSFIMALCFVGCSNSSNLPTQPDSPGLPDADLSNSNTEVLLTGTLEIHIFFACQDGFRVKPGMTTSSIADLGSPRRLVKSGWSHFANKLFLHKTHVR